MVKVEPTATAPPPTMPTTLTKTESVGRSCEFPWLDVGHVFDDLNKNFLGFEEQYYQYIERLFKIIKALNYTNKISSRKIYFDCFNEYQQAQRLKDQKRVLLEAFERQRAKKKDPNYNKRLERNMFKGMHKRYLSSIGYCQPKDSMIVIIRYNSNNETNENNS
jgi:hypothetical protein